MRVCLLNHIEMEVDEVSKGQEIIGEANQRTRSFNNEKENFLCENMLNHVAANKLVHFKSQQVGEPELSTQEKRDIAKDLLMRNPGQFLARFGNHLEEDHLDYFSGIKYDTYEIQFHLRQLRRGLSKEKKQIDIRNRRYQALKKLLDEGTYFSETEMMKRNPLLYEQLIGQFLTRKEIRERDKCDENAKTFLSVLMDQLDREEIERLKQQQRDDEEAAVEEVDTSDEETEESNVINGEAPQSVEGEEEEEEDEEAESDAEMSPSRGDRENNDNEPGTSQNSSQKPKKLSRKEKELLREEFVSSMYQSFIDGNDKDFDYSSTVDGNPDYECLAVRTQDEEEKYFDAESPEIISGDEDNTCGMLQGNDDEEEDELDLFMKNLKPEATPSDLATEMEKI